MWFEKTEKSVPNEAKSHRSPEERIEAGEVIQTFEDLDGLTVGQLLDVALDCDEPADPDACVACRAYAMWEEKRAEEMLEAARGALTDPTVTVSEQVVEDNENPALIEHLTTTLAEAAAMPEDKILLGDLETEETDLRLVFIKQVHELDLAVRSLMEGPPIPPANVSITDLAALKLGATEWVNMVGALGYSLPPEKQKILDAVERVVERLDR